MKLTDCGKAGIQEYSELFKAAAEKTLLLSYSSSIRFIQKFMFWCLYVNISSPHLFFPKPTTFRKYTHHLKSKK